MRLLPPLAVFLIIAAFFTATQPITPAMAVVSSIFVVLFALPTYLGVVRILGRKKGLTVLLALGASALAIETLALKTAIPYGRFTYTDVLGNKLFDTTPWTVAFAYPPILLLTYWFARIRHKQKDTFKILFSAAFDAMLIDMVLDPAAVSLGFWNWPNGGNYYNVPLVNFLGWIGSSFVVACVLHYFWHNKKVGATMAYSGLAILFFWTSVNLWLLHFVPAIIGVILTVYFSRSFWQKKLK